MPVLVGSDGWGSAAKVYERLFSSNPAKSPKGFVGFQTAYWRSDPQHNLGKKFIASYKKQHKSDPNAWSAVAFDAAWVLLHAIGDSSNRNLSAQVIANAMVSANVMEVATTDSFRFGQDRSPIKSVPFYRIDVTGVSFEAQY
jgi:ABC-type branched-subunit amino acid transport system substrate-binding protein